MNIETKYKVGDKVYVCIKEKEVVEIWDDVIEEIVLSKDGITYYLDSLCEEFKEEELIPINAGGDLVDRIDYLLTKREDIDGKVS